MIIDESDYIAHYGTPRHSGRYPWGSGGNEGTPRNPSFLDTIRELKAQGLSDKEIYEGMGISSTQYRARRTIALTEKKLADIVRAEELKYKKGVSNTAGAREMGINESSFRALLEPGAKERAKVLTNTADLIQKHVDEAWKNSKSPIDIGSGVEAHIPVGEGADAHIGVSQTKLAAAVAILQEKGYGVHEVKVPQVSGQHETNHKVLVPPGVTQKEAWQQRFNIAQIPMRSRDLGKVYGRVNHPPISVNPRRIQVRYGDEGGSQADGVIYVREGAKDLSLGKNRYAQVRILVGKDHYLKGMAVYKEGLPEGVDLVFNTNKKSTGNKLDAMKTIEPDQDYPFGSVVDQITINDGTPKEKNISAMNIVNEQGDWAKWARTLSSQMLSKQTPRLAREQLDVTYENQRNELEDIKKLTNPTVKRVLLEKFAEGADSAAQHLKAAALPGSNWHAILPLDSIKPTEVYAPNYTNGQRVVLVRYPHGGIFEIPSLTVNNRLPEGRSVIGDKAVDAIGIHHTVAQRLSGADFDGDTVLVIPNDTNRFSTADPLEELKDFDPQIYKIPRGEDGKPVIPVITASQKQKEMGNVSNLITDMTLKAAPHDQIARAIKHSMVVIDAEKHELNWKLSRERNGIAALKKEYQDSARGGASTLISRRKRTTVIPDRKPRPQAEGGPINPSTGRLEFVPSGKLRRDRSGNLVPKTIKVKQLSETTDAHSLSSGTPMERLYADHSNKLKALANEARLEAISTPRREWSPSAKAVFAPQVKSLKAKLSLVIQNRPRERKAQAITQAVTRSYFAAHPGLEESSKKKIKARELERARIRTGAKADKIRIEDDEWNAIQAGAISDNTLKQILNKADIDRVRELATPRTQVLMTPTKIDRARSMFAMGATRAEVAAQLGVSLSTLDASLSGKE